MKNGFFARSAFFHLPSSSVYLRFSLFLALAFFVAGCSPAGPRALRNGAKLLERGDYAAAMAQLKTAKTLLATNAQAWNYYGVACQHAGQFTNAALAYQNALKYDRDLMEAHYNFGCLWLEQGKPDAARMEFAAYTLRRGNVPEGWLKLGTAQLRADRTADARATFDALLAAAPENLEALRGRATAFGASGLAPTANCSRCCASMISSYRVWRSRLRRSATSLRVRAANGCLRQRRMEMGITRSTPGCIRGMLLKASSTTQSIWQSGMDA